MFTSKFHSKYVRECEKKQLDPLPCVLEACKGNSAQLNISGSCLTAEVCEMLAKCLRHGHPFKELNFADCLMGDEGLSRLLSFLKSDLQVVVLCLKGNNLRGKAAEYVGKLLKHNTTIQRLNLQWNSLGVWECGMKELAEGLAVNTSLEYLDLQSNHINHEGVTYLASALTSNSSLEELDLRWNSGGVKGGRALLSSLKYNHKLLCMHVHGNSIPVEVEEAIGMALSLRAHHQSLEVRHQEKTLHLSKELKQLQRDSRTQVLDLLGQMEADRVSFSETAHMTHTEISDLKYELQEREVTLATLEERLQAAESTLELNKAQCQELEAKLGKVMEEKEQTILKHHEEVASLKQQLVDMEMQQQEEVTSASARERELQERLQTVEMEKHLLEQRYNLAMAEFQQLKNESESRAAKHQVQMDIQEQRHKEQLERTQNILQDELKQTTELLHAREVSALQQMKEAESKAAKFEQDVYSLNHKLEVERMKAAADVEQLRQSLKGQEFQYEEQVHDLQRLHKNDKLRVSELDTKVAQLQSDKQSLYDELLSCKQKCNEISQQYEHEQSKWKVAAKHHEQEHGILSADLEDLQKTCSELKKSLEKQRHINSELQEQHHQRLRDIQRENAEQKQVIGQEKAVIQRMKQDELHRATMLKAALETYLITKD